MTPLTEKEKRQIRGILKREREAVERRLRFMQRNPRLVVESLKSDRIDKAY